MYLEPYGLYLFPAMPKTTEKRAMWWNEREWNMRSGSGEKVYLVQNLQEISFTEDEFVIIPNGENSQLGAGKYLFMGQCN